MGTIAQSPPQPPTYPLPDAEFERALRRGTGRALIHARTHGLSPTQRSLFQLACESAWSMDPQCEGSRAAWLFEIAEAASALDVVESAVRHRLGRQIAEGDSNWDWDQVCDLAVLLIRRGRPDLRPLLYNALSFDCNCSTVIADQQIIELDDADGLLFVARRMSEIMRDDPLNRVYYGDDLRYTFDEKHGAGAAAALLESARQTDPAVDLFCRQLLERGRERGKHTLQDIIGTCEKDEEWEASKQAFMKMPAAELIQSIEANSETRLALRWWGLGASEVERRALEARIADETSYDMLGPMLLAVEQVGLLTYTPRLLEWLMAQPRRRLTITAEHLARRTRHPELRRLALNPTPFESEYLDFLRANYEPGDDVMLLNTPLPDDEDRRHAAMFDVLTILEGDPAGDWTPFALFIYADTPCQNCRLSAVEALHARNAIPDWIRAEGLADAEQDLRALLAGSG